MRPVEILNPGQRRPSKAYLVNELRKAVFTWREQGYPRVTPTTKRLLQFWFKEDHLVNNEPFQFWFCQREAMETLIYIYEAVEEALANAVYHRGYEHQNRIEVNVRLDCIEILSYPGPLPPVDAKALKKRRIVARNYRNRRIGDFLKELDLTEGRATGFPKIYKAMGVNRSPPPEFTTDSDRNYFLTVLKKHPLSQVVSQELSQVEEGLSEQAIKILGFCRIARKRQEILVYIGLSNHPDNYKRHIKPLIESGKLELTIPDKPKHRNQKYRTRKRNI